MKVAFHGAHIRSEIVFKHCVLDYYIAWPHQSMKYFRLGHTGKFCNFLHSMSRLEAALASNGSTIGEAAKKSSNFFINIGSGESLNDNFPELPARKPLKIRKLQEVFNRLMTDNRSYSTTLKRNSILIPSTSFPQMEQDQSRDLRCLAFEHPSFQKIDHFERLLSL